RLGAGSSSVLSPANKAVVNHVFVISNGKIELAYVKVAFDQDLDAGTRIRIELRDDQDNVIASTDATLSRALPAKNFIQLELSPHLNIQSILNYDHIVVVVAGVELSL
ncbi:MAG: hypothetical protein ACPLZG_13400, partial [Thermoproteota archaeon]